MSKTYDAIIVGARCAGSPTAMLLARKDYRVLLVDQARFPSDTVSTHVMHPLAAASLARWGLLDRLIATGCPPIDTYAYDFGPFTLAGAPGTRAAPLAYCPRRTVLDKMLLDAAADAGAEVREGFSVEGVLIEDGRVIGVRGASSGDESIIEHARVVIGADGRNSILAEAVQPERYNERPPLLALYYAYWSGLPMDGRFETYIRPARGFAAAETHDGLTMVVGGWPMAEFAANRKDIEGNFLNTIDLAPAFADRLHSAKRQTRYAGAQTPNFFRKPFGPGWALVGDAGYLKDPVTGQGILDAFRDAELCARALDESFRGEHSFDAAMAAYQRERDDTVLAMYDFTCELARFDPPSPQMQQLLAAIHGNQSAMDGFARINAGTTSPAVFFAKDNIDAIMAARAS
jgi:2-polyprenyl-6-methoxyphenol hydroxylase-like FAD-dependent oxidoreductase